MNGSDIFFIEIAVNNRKIQIGCIYRATATDICIFYEELQVICQTLKYIYLAISI